MSVTIPAHVPVTKAHASSRRCRALRPAMLALALHAPGAGAAVPGDVVPAGGDGRHTVADVVRLQAIRDGSIAAPAERALANLAPATIQWQRRVIVRVDGTGAVNNVTVRVDHSVSLLTIAATDVAWNPALGPLLLDGRNLQPGRVNLGGAIALNASFSPPAALYCLRFQQLGDTAPPPSLSRCEVGNIQGETVLTATCALNVRAPEPDILVPPVESDPWIDDEDVARARDLAMGRVRLAYCWE